MNGSYNVGLLGIPASKAHSANVSSFGFFEKYKLEASLTPYVELAKQDSSVLFGGRLGMYRYFDMDQIVQEALSLVKKEIG